MSMLKFASRLCQFPQQVIFGGYLGSATVCLRELGAAILRNVILKDDISYSVDSGDFSPRRSSLLSRVSVYPGHIIQ